MKLHVVGTGCPDPLPERYGSSFILEVGSDCLMVDCGPATTYKMARMALRPGCVNHVFLTHHHFDHNADFPCFALTRWDQSKGTEPPLKVYGPPPTKAFVEKLLGEDGAFAPDWKSRITHPASHECHRARGGVFPRPAPAIEAVDVDAGRVAEEDGWSVAAAGVKHVEPGLLSVAYRFDTDKGSVTFAGDCADCEELRQLAQGTDTLVIACTHFGVPTVSPAIADVITGTPEVAAIANAAQVTRLILTHTSPNFSRPGVKERAIAEVARNCNCEMVFPDELTTVEL